ncbi:hypothetical protein HRbin01_01088 [archaeon HR01]|nr:hypothetical protein HRbin01_01088 [archaeon HR01]
MVRALYAAVAAVLLAGLAAGVMLTLQTRPAGQYFIVDVQGERFTIYVTDPETIKLAEENMRGGNNLFPTGALARGDGGFNSPWSWHLIPETVRMAEVSIELCDGLPSHIEQALDYWIDTVGQFCPWSGRIVGKP